MSVVTVIIPCAWKHRYYLPRAIQSVKENTVEADILIVNDDASPLISEYPTLNTYGQRGTAYARNLALSNTTSDFVIFLDADDYLLDTSIELMLRAYAEYDDACYIYGDWYQFGRDESLTFHQSKDYDRVKGIKHSLHLVTTLIPTEIARDVGFDESYRGWEDVLFYIELGRYGYCGTRIPHPILVYDMGTSINREKHNAIEHEVYPELLSRYEGYLKGETEFMACQTCGGNARQTARQVVNQLPPTQAQGKVLLEYTLNHSARRAFRVNGTVYYGARDGVHQFVNANPQDVQTLIANGFRKVVTPSKPTVVPATEQFQEWRKKQPKVEVPPEILAKSRPVENQE